MLKDPNPPDLDTVYTYHAETKHHFHRYARSLGYLDWATQPNPFRYFLGSSRIQLPFADHLLSPPYGSLYQCPQPQPTPLDIYSVSFLLQHSMAISAWKEYGSSRWALRVNPSSGNLHPTETYLLMPELETDNASIDKREDRSKRGIEEEGSGGRGGLICHYCPAEHLLEVRSRVSAEVWRELVGGYPAGTFLVGLSSIHWREAWKYGERAFRYCQHDTGHALAAIRLAAAMLGWRMVVLEGLGDAQICALLGLDREEDFQGAEREHPDLIAAVITEPSCEPLPMQLPEKASAALAAGDWYGRANALSREHVQWPIIDKVSAATLKPSTSVPVRVLEAPELLKTFEEALRVDQSAAATIVQQRRSAVDFDAKTEISSARFYRMLSATVPATDPARRASPWDAITWPVAVHLLLFVHRVSGLLPGLYVLARDAQAVAELRARIRPDALWQRPPECPDELPLYFLLEGDCRSLARQVSCHQNIAADSAFSLGMLAEFEAALSANGGWYYRRLFWETGMIGQVLYLEAEALGVRGTGIGCFFDNPVHEVAGLEGWKYQSLYHFTIGGPVEDHRLTTLPPYGKKKGLL